MKTLANILTIIVVISSVVYSSKAQVRFSERVGGTNGEDFMLPAERYDILSTERIWRVGIKHSRRIEKIEIQYTNRQDSSQWESAGNDDGEWSYFELKKGEYIVYITGRAGTLIDQVTFHTSAGRAYGPYGGTGGQEFDISIPPNAVVIGFTGKEGPSIKQIGLIYRIMGEGNDKSEKSKPVIRDHRTKGPGTTTSLVCPSRNENNRTGGFVPEIMGGTPVPGFGNNKKGSSITPIARRVKKNRRQTGKEMNISAKNIVKVKDGRRHEF